MKFDDKVINIPDTLPMLPVRDIVVFPYMILPLYVGRENSIRAVEEALSKNRLIFLSSQKEIAEHFGDTYCFFTTCCQKNPIRAYLLFIGLEIRISCHIRDKEESDGHQ